MPRMSGTESHGETELARYASQAFDQVPILLVDDREENLVALEAVLRNPGYKLIKTHSGDDALRYLLENIPALILMDVQMPGLDGYETASIIKSNPRTRDIPIIFITAINTDERFVHRGYEHGAIDYIYKPFDSHVLRSKVAVLTELYRKTERLVQAERALRESEALERERKIADLELRSLRREQLEQKRYRNLVEGIDHGFVWAAEPETMALSFASAAAQKLTGYTPEQWVDTPGFFFQQMDESDHNVFRAAVEKAVNSGGEVRIEHRIRTAKGQNAWFHTGMRVSAKTDGMGKELRGLSVDITPLKSAELTLAQAKKRSDILVQASLLLSESVTCATPLQSVATFLREKLCDFCLLESYDLPAEYLALASSTPEHDGEILRKFRSHPPAMEAGERDYWANGASKVSTSLNPEKLGKLLGSPERATVLKNLGLRSTVQVGLAWNGKFLGLLTLGFTRENSHGESDTSLAEDIAYRISSTLENAALFQKAESAIRLRDEFLSIASHELRTPLTPLKIRVQQMQRLLSTQSESKLPVEQLHKSVETCNRQIERLSKLIDDLLDISRISRGKLSLHPEKFSLTDLIRDIVTRFAGPLEAAGCAVQLQLGEDLGVNLDLSRIEQVIVNLLTNAIKYAPGLPIEISAQLVGREVELSVRDHGMGIDPKDQARIFQRFERAVSSNHFGGLGLGLYIVSQILSAHGGRISVHSEPGQGSTFLVHLPLTVALEGNKEVTVDLPA